MITNLKKQKINIILLRLKLVIAQPTLKIKTNININY